MQTDKELYYEFDCGCKFKAFGTTPKNIDDLPPIEVDFYNLRDCPNVWSIFENGNTKGIFQLESQLGQDWSSKLKPESLDDLAALTALIRPGSLESEIDGKSMTQAYVDRKHGLNEPIPPHPALENAYKNTYGVSCFQEQNILAVQEVAGFTESEAEKYRKAVGKKLVDVMAELHPKFVDGCVKNGLSKDEAEKIFQILKAAERYSFNACLSPETIVQKNDGNLVSLDNIKIGDFINSPDGYIEVVNKYETGEQELFEITLESGKTIECTMNHKFKCEDSIIRPLYEIISNNHKIITNDYVL